VDSLHKKIDEVDQSQNLTATAMNKQLEDYEIQNNMKVDGLLQHATQTNEKGMSLYILLKVIFVVQGRNISVSVPIV
jgi:hypothetical protein